MEVTSILFFAVLGIFSGMVSATFGVGGGVIVVPALTMYALMPQKSAQGIALVVMVPMAVMGALRYYWNPDIQMDWRIIAVLTIAAIIGANIGAEIVGRVSNRSLQMAFGFFVLFIAISMIWKAAHAPA